MNNAKLTMDSVEWYTPDTIVTAAHMLLGVIELDPASHPEANLRVQARKIFTQDDNGLAHDWRTDDCRLARTVFLNPPGGLVNAFWCKLIDTRAQAQLYNVPFEALWIGYSLEQLQTLQNSEVVFTPLDFPMCVPKTRVKFVESAAREAARLAAGKRKASSPTHANYITYIGPRVDLFAHLFASIGQVRL